MASFLSYHWENCRNIGRASYGHGIRKFEKKVDAFENVVWWSTYQHILKRIAQPCFRTVLHGFLIDKLLIVHKHLNIIRTKIHLSLHMHSYNIMIIIFCTPYPYQGTHGKDNDYSQKEINLKSLKVPKGNQ